MSNISIHLQFLEPYRLVEFNDKNGKKELRGLSFARWQKKNGTETWRSIIRGSLLRSTVIRSAEEILSITSGKVKVDNNSEIECCNGKFKTEDIKRTRNLRKRPTLNWKNNRTCTKESPCPYCVLLGPGSFEGKNEKDKYIFRFTNIELVGYRNFPKDYLQEIATERVLNRIDPHTGKAFDYFKVWEVEDKGFWHYKGKIEINDTWFKDKNNGLKDASIKLLEDSLKFIDRLCGALCVIETQEEKRNSPSPQPSQGVDPETAASKSGKEVSPSSPVFLKTTAERIAYDLFTIFENTNNMEKLRILADGIRAMRLKSPDIVKELPIGKKGKDGKDHFLWDKVKFNNKNARKILEEAITNEEVKNNWREFCESVGQCLYGYYKESRGGIITRERLLGDTEYYSKQVEAGNVIPIDGESNVKEWIFVGRLKAETPFFIGTEARGGDQTSIQILLGKTGRYRIPRSVLRGTLRNDLRFASGTGCNVELGLQRPCDCCVCIIMRKITIKDSPSDYSEPPEIRQRIRRNPFVGIVDEGALFDIEVGPEGVAFPFVLRYRGDKLPEELTDVMHSWKDGQLFLGGSISTGKGRFKLELEHLYKWEITTTSLKDYIKYHGLRGEEFKISSRFSTIPNLENYLKEVRFPEKSKDYKEQWQKVEYKIKISSPLLSADPIEALFDKENHDSIVFQKRIVKERHVCPDVPAFKGETIRGIVRTAFGRIHTHKEDGVEKGLFEIEHEDCTCSLCKIFGNEHEASNIRFEDLTIEYENKKKLDHVAIDRFQGGAAEQKKFDDCPIAGSPDDPIVLRGRFWIRHDLSPGEKDKIIKALCEIRDGSYPLGGKGGIGYGWVGDVEILNPTSDFFLPPKKQPEEDTTKEPKPFNYPPLPELNLDKNAVYYPHYFLKPHEKVYRELENKLIGHQKYHEGLYTGKIECTLRTLTPLIIPDSENVTEDNKHKTYKFFRINGKEMIPGSEIRGPLSSVYEALTNSCFRVMEEDRYLSRRINPDEKDVNNKRILEKFVPGRISIKNGKVFVVKVEQDYRLPLYDEESVTKAIKDNDYIVHLPNNGRNKERNDKVKKANLKIAEIANKNLTYLRSLMKIDRQKFLAILTGREKIKFDPKPNIYKKDMLAELHDNGAKEGYIKFTGLNMVNTENMKNVSDRDYDPNWDVWSLNITLNTDPDNLNERFRASLRHKYPRPFLSFIKDEKRYFIPKRCERVFLAPDKNSKCYYEVPDKVRNQYRDILEDYKSNFGHINEKFRTLLENCELREGILIYFMPDEVTKTAISIMPVRISRKTDSDPLGNRLPFDSNNLRPCEREILEEDIDANLLSSFSEKMLFRRHEKGFCPACRLFGTTSYKSRVRFGFAELQGEPKWLKDDNGNDIKQLTLPLLEKPRPIWSMSEPESKVPGRKFYVHHNGWEKIKKDFLKGSADYLRKTENNRTVEPLTEGNEFKFEVFFENLEAWELGLLLYSLELEDGLAHKIGMGKAFGFGSVKIEVKDVLLRNTPNGWHKATKCKNAWLEAELKQLEGWFDGEWSKVQHIHELRCLLKYSNIPNDIKVRYPALRQEEDKKEKFPGYVELKDITGSRGYLTRPWFPWYPCPEGEEIPESPVSPHLIVEGSATTTTSRRSPDIAPRKAEGRVKWFNNNEGYGFITMDNGTDIFVHVKSIKEYSSLKEGQGVKFNIKKGKKGHEAYDVEIVE